MTVKEIASPKNPLLQKIRRLADSAHRKQSGLYLIEGPKLIGEALGKNVELVDLVSSKSFFNAEPGANLLAAVETLTVVDDQVFNTLCTTTSSCGILATAKPALNTLAEILKRSPASIVFGECIQDPGNLGTIIRTALAFQCAGLILSKGSVDYLSPKVVRGSMGAVFSLPILAEQEVEACLLDLKANQAHIIALDAKAGQRFDSLKPESNQTVYLFGNEGNGLSIQALQLADQSVSIPISSDSESLNVAVAMGIVLYHSQRTLNEDERRSR